MSAVVAIVGRPNVGKSTLFNRLIGRRHAIESDIPGTTRDRLYQTLHLPNYSVLLVDTGGLELDTDGTDIEENIQEQSRVAIEGADLILFVIDLRAELTSEDFHAADLLRKSGKPVLLIANKCDNRGLLDLTYNLYELGFDQPIPVSAIHSEGMDELSDQIEAGLKKLGIEPTSKLPVDNSRIKIALLGRPNVGKSTMINALFGKKMVVTSEIPGTTRDSSLIPFDYDGNAFTLIDTAGIRRRGSIESGIEHFSVLRSLQSVSEADICVLIMDFEEGVTNQDCHVSQYILEEQKGLILVVNKIDIEKGEEREERENMYIHELRQKMAYVPWAPLVFTSALERKNIFKILDLSALVAGERRKQIPQETLNVWLDHVLMKQPPKGKRGKHLFNVNVVEQVSILPPTFVFECDWPEIMHFSYARFLENELRGQFGFEGAAMKLIFKKSGERRKRRENKEPSLIDEYLD